MAVQLAEQCVCSKEKDWARVDERMDKIEDKLDAQCETMWKLDAKTTITNDHLARIETALEKFPEAEKEAWEGSWEKILEKVLEKKPAFNPTASLIRIVEFLIAIILILLGGEVAGVFNFVK